MSFNDCKIRESEIQTTGVQSQADTLTGSAADNKMVFDALPTLVIQKLNSLIEQMQQQAAAGQIGVTPFDGMTAQTLQEALEQIQADIGGNYGGADGAGKVGYTPSEGVDEDTVQAAIEAVQANLTAYIAKIKAATGAAEVGNAPIAGMTATNVQQALEELRENIDNIVSGIIPGGSITSDMIQDGAVTADKLGSDVTGDTIPTSASDPTSISSQLSNLDVSKVQISNLSGVDLNEITTDGHYRLSGGCTNVPITGGGWEQWTQLLVITGAYSDNTTQIMPIYWDGTIWVRTIKAPGTWTEWSRLATATKPQEFDLPLAEGVSAVSSAYWKDQFGVVTGHFNVLVSSSQTGSSPVIATLPEGFRPSRQANATAVVSSGESLGLLVLVTGEIQLQDAASVTLEGKYIKGLFSFVAAT